MKLTEAKLKELILEALEEGKGRNFEVTLPPPSRQAGAPPEKRSFLAPKGWFVGRAREWPDGASIRLNKNDKERTISFNLDKFGYYGPDYDGIHLSTSIRTNDYWYNNPGPKSKGSTAGTRMLRQQLEHDEKYLYDKFTNDQIFEAIQNFLEKIKNL